jgi:hypothetical protein
MPNTYNAKGHKMPKSIKCKSTYNAKEHIMQKTYNAKEHIMPKTYNAKEHIMPKRRVQNAKVHRIPMCKIAKGLVF